MTGRENPLLQPSVSGGSKTLPVTVQDHPVLGLRDGLERVSRTACVTAKQYGQDGEALAKALVRCEQLVNKRVGARDRAGTFYYVTYEVVVDGDSSPGRPVRPPVAGQAADVLQQRVPRFVVSPNGDISEAA